MEKMMYLNIILTITILNFANGIERQLLSKEMNYNNLDEHTIVTDSNVFPYVVAILKAATYVSSGALINSNWVLTAADSLYFLREASRMLRVRLGSINYRKGGLLLPIKFYLIHPDFNYNNPVYDVALIKLSDPVRYTPTIRPISLQKIYKEVDAAHFVVPAWLFPIKYSDESKFLESLENIKRRRLLSVTHVHPSDHEDCTEELNDIDINITESIMCLDTGIMADPCMRNIGAPVVLNDVLWGIISSWKPMNCQNDLAGPSFANLVATPNISTWIHETISESDEGHNQKNLKIKTELYRRGNYITPRRYKIGTGLEKEETDTINVLGT